MPFFNFPQFKSMETLSRHSNQTKEANFHKKYKLPIPQPKDATDEIWAKNGPKFHVLEFPSCQKALGKDRRLNGSNHFINIGGIITYFMLLTEIFWFQTKIYW